MKKLCFLFPIILILAGCELKNENSFKYLGEFDVTVIDSCEYIVKTPSLYRTYFAHKGNCRFCEERRKKEEIKDICNKLDERGY